MKKIIQVLFLQLILGVLSISVAQAAECGESFVVLNNSDISGICNCSETNNQASVMVPSTGLLPGYQATTTYCCGFNKNGICRIYEDEKKYGCGEYNGSETVPEGATCSCNGGGWESYVSWNFLWVDRNVCCGFVNEGGDQCLKADPDETNILCGKTYTTADIDNGKECICGGGAGRIPLDKYGKPGEFCCGWVDTKNGNCKSDPSGISNASVSGEILSSLNPLAVGGGDGDLSTPGGIISKALSSFIFPIAGIILFVVLLLGGFQMLTGATNSKSIDEGKQRITAAIIGFILLFAAYWIAQLLELIFGIRILS